MVEVSRSRHGVGRKMASRLVAVALVAAGAVSLAPSAGAATATVANGLTTTDLAAPGMTPASLASSLVGPGVTVSNVTYSGAAAQAGQIHLVDPAVVSFNDGVIMSSGNIADVVGPNKSESTTGDMAGPQDPQLTALIANTQTVNPMTYDAASLEFDFVPTANQVYFTYTFGSDEYLEWVNLFNDVFAFYVNGQNCATVPSGDPVSIDTINSNVNPQLYRDNSFWNPPANPINIEPDGLSVEMICTANVQAGQVNHMKLAIADTSDQILDSVVMIKAHSLSTTKPEACNDSVDNDDDLLVDLEDPSCTSTLTPPPPGGSGIGSSSSAPPFTGNEGTAIPLDASALGWTATPDTVSVSWAVSGINGTTAVCDVIPSGKIPVVTAGVIPVAEATCPVEGEYVARVDGWDAEGAGSFDKDVDFFVHNAPPVVTLDSPVNGATATIGSPMAVSASVVDPGGDAVTCDIDWGDGTVDAVSPSGGACDGSHAYAAAGSYVVSVTATDTAGDSAAAAAVVSAAAAGVTVSSDANPSVKGQAVTLVGATTLGTTGKMTFYTGTTSLGTKVVAGGTASLVTSALAVGTHQITVVYKQTTTSTPVVSGALIQVVDPAPTSVSLTSDINPSVTGQAVTLKATVATLAPGSGVAAGTVTLMDGDVAVSTRMLSAGATSFSVKPTVGSHTYTAVFNGSASFLGSVTPGAVAQQVDPASTTLAVTSSANPSVVGQAVTVKVTAKAVLPGSGAPSGTVTLYDGATAVGSKPLSAAGAASFSLRPTVGSHGYTATYDGSASYLGSASGTPLVQQVDPASTTVAVTSSANPSVFGQAVSVRVAVKAVLPGSGAPSGTVTLYDGATVVGAKPLTSGSASFSLKPTVGSHSYTATYEGSPSYLASASGAPLDQAVNPASTTVALTSAYPTTTAGHAGSITATLKAVAPRTGVPSGTVQFFDGATLVATATLVAGKATMPIASLPVGVHSLTASYVGDGSYAPSTSGVLTQTIT